MNFSRTVARKATASAVAPRTQQKRTAFIEIASTHMSTALFVSMVGTLAYSYPRLFQDKYQYHVTSETMPMYLAQEEKRNIAQLSKQMDNTATKWARLPSAGAFRSASTHL